MGFPNPQELNMKEPRITLKTESLQENTARKLKESWEEIEPGVFQKAAGPFRYTMRRGAGAWLLDVEILCGVAAITRCSVCGGVMGPAFQGPGFCRCTWEEADV
jgi:hypothetical protein